MALYHKIKPFFPYRHFPSRVYVVINATINNIDFPDVSIHTFKAKSKQMLWIPLKMLWEISGPRNYCNIFTLHELNLHEKRNIHLFIGTCKLNSKSRCNYLNDKNRPLVPWDTCVIIMIVKYASKQFCEFMKNAGDKKYWKNTSHYLKKNGPNSRSQGNKRRNRNHALNLIIWNNWWITF